MFRTRTQRALLVWGVVAVVAGGALEYGLGKIPLHPTDKFFYLLGNEPIGIALPWHNDNPIARKIYDGECGGLYPQSVNHRRVSMCVKDIMRPDLREKHKVFAAEVDEDFRQYWFAHAEKVAWALLYGFCIWFAAVVSLFVVRWVAKGEKGDVAVS